MQSSLDAAFSQLAHLVVTPDAFQEILEVVKEVTRVATLPCCTLPSGKMLYRARINQTGKPFCNREEISYIRDSELITRYGRANMPGKSLFYCSDDIMTAFLETVDSRLREHTNDAGSVTIGCWRAIRPVEDVALVINSSETLTQLFPPDSDAGKAMALLIENKDQWEMELWSKALDYLVARFSERVTHRLQYQITSAIFEVLIRGTATSGIAYPSVLSEELSSNFALTPVACDTRLKLVDVVRIDFKKEEDSVEMREKFSDYFDRNGGFRFDA